MRAPCVGGLLIDHHVFNDRPTFFFLRFDDTFHKHRVVESFVFAIW